MINLTWIQHRDNMKLKVRKFILSKLFRIKFYDLINDEGVSFGENPQSREVNNDAFTNFMAILSMDSYKYALQLTDK